MPESPPFDGRRDLDRAVTELADRLPGALAALAGLAFNYRWAWLPDGPRVFADVDPALWRQSCCNVRWVLESVAPRRLRELADDRAYVERVAHLAQTMTAELARPPLSPWPVDGPVAYLCAEFGVHCSLPIYGGGLGVLAGDVLKSASDLAMPMVGIGLAYREGYFHQRLDLSGWQHEYWVRAPFEHLPMVLVTGPDDRPLVVSVRLRGRPVQVQAWRVQVGRVPLYLLDTDRDDNHPIDRWITRRLYVGDRDTRLAQYAVLGIAGRRMLEALGVRPGLVHLNEGHASLTSIEQLRVALERRLSSEDALAAVRAATVFTTHTPVAAGNEGYRPDEVEHVLGDFLGAVPVPRSRLLGLGRIDPANGEQDVTITTLALRTSGAANGVSRRHGAVARDMWRTLWPGRSVDAVPIGHVTNGVHVPTWMADAMQSLLDRHLAGDWRDRLDLPETWAMLEEVPDEALWQVRGTLRRRLVDYVRDTSVQHRLGRGEGPDFVEAAARAFDPSVLTFGFARRVATYKRLHLLTREFERALGLLADPARPVQVVIAGKAHPQDDEAKHLLREVMEHRHTEPVGSRIVFLEDYDLHMAPTLVAGCDVWVNLPRPPLEASGTSGMKSVMNGGLQLSVLDGWWDEAFDPALGWAIRTPAGSAADQDAHDAAALLGLVQDEVAPLFYQRDADGLPRAWIARVRASMRRLVPRFSGRRMLREYVAGPYQGAGHRS